MADGTLKVGEITNSAGSGNITIGSGVTVNVNKPAFEAYLSAPGDAVDTKIAFDTVTFDTDSMYDNTTNYRATIPTGAAGKYMVYCCVFFGSTSETIDTANLYMYKNGSVHTRLQMRSASNEANAYTITESKVMDLAENDYIEFYGMNDVSSGTPNFGGVSRRLEFKADLKIDGKSATLIDDYGHHPKEIEQVIVSLRRHFKKKKVLMIFQPHRFSRTKMLFKDFISTLSKVDKVFLLPIYSASEKEIKGVSSKNMAQKLNTINGKDFCSLVKHENVNDMVEQCIDKYDVVITQGAGNVSMVSKGLIKKWKI